MEMFFSITEHAQILFSGYIWWKNMHIILGKSRILYYCSLLSFALIRAVMILRIQERTVTCQPTALQ
jgi:hypothetical protein